MDVKKLIQEATEAANAAGDLWMKNATVRYVVKDGGQVVDTLLDVCGNSHVRFTDRRTKAYKAFDNEGYVTTNGVIRIPHKFEYRQEYGLHQSCSAAAMQILRDRGLEKLNLWSYID